MTKKFATETERIDTAAEETQTNTDDSWKNWRQYRSHRHGSNGGLLLILIGIIFLLNNFGLLSSDIWHMLWRFWPVFLILFGIQMLGGKSKKVTMLITAIGIFVVIALLTFVLTQINPVFSHWLYVQFPFLSQMPY